MENSAESGGEQPETHQLDQSEAKRYGRLGLQCMLWDRAIDVAYIGLFAFLAARPLDRYLQESVGWQAAWIRLAAMYLIMTCGHIAVSLPLSFYSGFTLEHQFGLSRQTLKRWLTQYAKSMGIAIGFNIVMVQLLFWTIWITGSWWWIVAAIGSFFVIAGLGQLAPIIILPLFYKIDRLENEELEAGFTRLTDGTGLSIEGIYRMNMSEDTVKANAMLAGLGKTRRVILGDTLLDKFSNDEIQVVFAHEVGHHVHRHIRKLIMLMFMGVGASFFLCDRVFIAMAQTLGLEADYRTLPVWTLPLLFLLLTLIGMLVEPLHNGLSRYFERQADRYALDSTRADAAFRSAFRKLAALNKADMQPHPLEVFLFHSHPPIQERLAMAE